MSTRLVQFLDIIAHYGNVFQFPMILMEKMAEVDVVMLPEVVAFCIKDALQTNRNLSWKIQH